jgi:hypothetical protein
LNPENQSELIVCTRNRAFTLDRDLFTQKNPKNPQLMVAQIYDLKTVLSKAPNLVLQGEIYGPTIQENQHLVESLKFAVFTIYDLINKQYCNMKELINYCQQLELEMVEIDSSGDHFNFTIDQLLENAKGLSIFKNKKYT